ncbi:ATP-binding protein [Candidatus Woesearchaeota archaeon]|nr:ATP-binding protein [Candidatus Woesearchaeota archaeon]
MGKGDRIPTGISGFDALIDGGFVPDSFNLVTGGTGTGKTIFSLQFAHNSIKSGQKVLFITFEENVDALIGDAAEFGWDFSDHSQKEKCFFVSLKPLSNPNYPDEFAKIIKKNSVKIVVIDSVSVLSMVFQGNFYKMRREMYLLTDLLRALRCTTVATAEVEGEASLDVTSSNKLSRDGVVEFIADAVITMHNAGIGGEADRAIRVLKMRRTPHEKSPVPMKITNKGLVVLKDKGF